MKHAVVLMVSLCFVRSAAAQEVPTAIDDPVAEAPIRLGALGVGPRLRLNSLGVDTNVFNEPADPKSDFTFAVEPGADLWLRTGRGLWTFAGGLEFVYFNEYETERAINSNARAQYEFRFNRLRPFVSASTLNTSQRPGYEIDARARHYEADFHAGTDVRVASKGTVRLDARHLDYSFAGDEVFNGRPLNQELNRTLRGVDVAWRQRLTVLTTWVTRVSGEQERFQYESIRNSDSFRVSSGFELARLALIRGTAFVGFRKLTPAEGGVFQEFAGLTADVGVSYTMPTQTRLSAEVDRDLQYSYVNATPYYVLTAWTATVTQRVVGAWDLQVSGGRDRLAYEAIVPVDARTDFIDRVGGGLGYAIGEDIRMSLDVHSYHRRSRLPENEYGGMRAGISVTYGY